MRYILIILYFTVITTESSKCPESRKPHPTSCTVFYNCVNLPDGGYVWVPSKCTEGLIFEPHLRICVLPGDSWTCDTLSTESSIVTNRYDSVPELINSNETSYMGSTQDPVDFSELIDSSYITDSIPDEPDQEMATPYPLIEVEETTNDNGETNTDNFSVINNLQHDYLQAQNDSRKQYLLLNQLIQHLLVYKEITIPLEFLTSSLSTPSTLNTKIPLSNEVKFTKDNQHNVLMNYLIQNYIQQNNNLQNNIITGTQLQNTTMRDSTVLKDADANKPMLNIENSNNTLSTTFDNLENENNIISIVDNVGNKQYLTIERYKALGYPLNSQSVQVLPCIRNIRLPNVTNCLRYYVCEPERPSVIEYSCPLFTAFNAYIKICDTESYSKCIRKVNINIPNGADNVFQKDVTEENICTEHGKIKDPTSESRYYICHSDKSQNIKAMRMTCPNNLIFCQTKKVCTTKRFCKGS
ncbi:uncharacterized protein LOC105663842 isoform X1 [Megachile rotundata]|uniref:uncharacterized protein LOC105663842 isoform X1 n=1 Tax=Megachile rotundata TaxID=143995 RepID=UPI003FD16F02